MPAITSSMICLNASKGCAPSSERPLMKNAGVPVTGAGGFESANLPVMAGHVHGGMLEVHGAHAAIKARFATHPEFREGQLHVPGAAGLGFSLRD